MLEINNTTKQKINLKQIRKIVDNFLRVYKKSDWEVSLALVGDAAIKKLNRDYRGIAKITDVLSFTGDAATRYLGEIVINLREAGRVNKYQKLWREIAWNEKLTRETVFYFLIVHGLLHLVGYDDAREPERRRMLELGRKFLEKML